MTNAKMTNMYDLLIIIMNFFLPKTIDCMEDVIELIRWKI